MGMRGYLLGYTRADITYPLVNEEARRRLAMKIRAVITQSIYACLQEPADTSDELEEIVDVLEYTALDAAELLNKIHETFGDLEQAR